MEVEQPPVRRFRQRHLRRRRQTLPESGLEGRVDDRRQVQLLLKSGTRKKLLLQVELISILEQLLSEKASIGS